jgi:hypothetical protein
VVQTNWYILDNKVYSDIGEDFEKRGPASIFYPEGGLDETRPIELIPTVDDTTVVFLKYLDDNGLILSERRVNGPTAKDVFAVKEKFYIPKFLELPITKGVPYKSINVYDSYNIAAIRNELINLKNNGSFSMMSGDGRVDAIQNQDWYNDVINNAFQPIIDLLDPNSFFTVFNLLSVGAITSEDIVIQPDGSLGIIESKRIALQQKFGNLTAVIDDDYFKIFYRLVATIITNENYVEDDDTRNFSDRLRSEESINHFQYLINANFRNNVDFNQWRYAMLLANDAYQGRGDKNGITKREAYQIQQRFYIFEQFLNFSNKHKKTTTESIRYSNSINIFGQPYSTVNAIANSDSNIRWINQKINTLTNGLPNVDFTIKSDPGASAFFAINDNQVIPRGTRQVEITFEFNHSSEAYIDQSPETKDWSSSELYIDLFGSEVSTEGEKKYVKLSYGAPRCAITSMKYALFPNRVTVDSRYNSYLIPEQNVWYVEKTKLEQNIHNSANGLVFNYTTVDNIKPLPTSQPFTQDQINRDVEQPG